MNSIYQAKLFLVDDNPDLIRLLCDQLYSAGYQNITTASNCAEAWTAFAMPSGVRTTTATRTISMSTSAICGKSWKPTRANRSTCSPSGASATSSHRRRSNEDLHPYHPPVHPRRDTARTNWIAGVSHDIRTPLSLILGWAEQLGQDATLPDSSREKANDIRTQSEKIRSLIEDLNLTSKLQYGAQPLRCRPLTAGPFLRELAAEFYESPFAGSCELELSQTEEAEHAILNADKALLTRAVENLLNNSVHHNTRPVTVTVTLMAQITNGLFQLTVSDNGQGYPPTVLAALREPETSDNAPHILGLHVVEQILQAHGGHVVFGQNLPKGAKSDLFLPVKKK